MTTAIRWIGDDRYSESDDCEGDQLVALSFQYVDVEAFEKAKRDELD